MTWGRIEVALEVSLPGLPTVRAKAVSLRNADGRRQGLLHLTSVAGWSLDLEEAIDTSAGSGREAIHVMVSEARGGFFTVGGRLAYTVSAAGEIEARLELNRDLLDEEYWSTELHETAEGILIVYEGGLFLIGHELNVVWHRRKVYNDRVDAVSADQVHIVGDRQERWSLSLTTGLPFGS